MLIYWDTPVWQRLSANKLCSELGSVFNQQFVSSHLAAQLPNSTILPTILTLAQKLKKDIMRYSQRISLWEKNPLVNLESANMSVPWRALR